MNECKTKCVESVGQTPDSSNQQYQNPGYLDKKIIREGWSQGISCQWIHLAAKCSKKWCNCLARYALLRWSVNQDDDVWLALRGTRHAQLCQGCGLSGDTFPGECRSDLSANNVYVQEASHLFFLLCAACVP